MKVGKRAKTGYLPRLLPFLLLCPRANCHVITRFETLATEVGKPVWVDSCKLVAAELTFISSHFIPFA